MVLLPNMDLPNRCITCPILDTNYLVDGEYYCPLITKFMRKEDAEKSRDTDCPMVDHEWNELDNKCKSNVKIYPDGENELDPCQYVLVDRRKNCVVEILRCEKCGHIEILWTDKDLHPECLDEDDE